MGAAVLSAGAAATVVLAAPSGWLAVDGNIRFAGAGGTVDWANSGPPGVACANGGVDITGSGGLFNCGRPGSGGAPPIAPTLTPTAAADPSLISAVFIVDPIAGDAAGCGGNDPTILSGTGPKNGDPLGTYSISAGSPPAKDDLANVYAVTHTRADGHPEIYFGAEKLTNNGETHMDFEFMQSVVGRTAACGGTFTGHRTEGDLLFSVDFATGGSVPTFSVHVWHCNVDPGVQPPDGTVCDPGGSAHYQDLGSPAAADLTVNAADIACGGWICRDQDTGVPTLVKQNNFLEGGVDLQALPFIGCFNTFLPHTRTSGAFDATLKDFAGPVTLKSCKDPAAASTSSPTGSGVSAGSTATDTVTLTNGGAGLAPAGTITFFLCNPAGVSAGGCVSGGTQVGAVKTIVGGVATSDPSAPLQFNGKYCWRTAYTPDASLAGVYEPATHTNATTECLTVFGGANLPNTGVPLAAVPTTDRWLPISGLLLIPSTAVMLAWRRTRLVAALVIAGLVAGASPTSPQIASPQGLGSSGTQRLPDAPATASTAPLRLATVHAHEGGWRLVIPRLGIDALIEPVGLDRGGAMAAPSTLDRVGWLETGPSPGQVGDAVVDGHYGAGQPAVFRRLHQLRPGDEIDVVWPDGRVVAFEVAGSQVVGSGAHPAGVFTRDGPARLTLITCAGAWDAARATYADRLLVTAMLA